MIGVFSRGWVRWCLSAAVLCTPGAAQEAAEKPSKITIRQGFPFVDVMVNGRGPFRMLVDTGAMVSILTPAAAERAGVVPDRRNMMVTFTGEKIVPASSNNAMQVGGTTQAGLPIMITEIPRVQELDRRAEGVLGSTFLERMPYLLDYGQKSLWLGDAATREAERLSHASTAITHSGRTLLPVTLEPGSVWHLQLDSGATNLIVDCRTRCPHSTELPEPRYLMTQAGQKAVTVRTLRHVAIGNQRMGTAQAVLLEDVSDLRSDEGVLPANWFNAFYVSGSTVRFEPAR